MLCHLAAIAALAVAADPRAVSPDGKLEAVAKNKIVIVQTAMQPPRILMKMAGHAADITALAYSPDGKMLASGDKAGGVRMYDAGTGKELRRFALKEAVATLAFSPDGKSFSVASAKGVKKYDPATGKETK